MILNMFHEKLPSVREFVLHWNKISAFLITTTQEFKDLIFELWKAFSVLNLQWEYWLFLCVVWFNMYWPSIWAKRSADTFQFPRVGLDWLIGSSSDRLGFNQSQHYTLRRWPILKQRFFVQIHRLMMFIIRLNYIVVSNPSSWFFALSFWHKKTQYSLLKRFSHCSNI